jgi:hypothetical protein
VVESERKRGLEKTFANLTEPHSSSYSTNHSAFALTTCCSVTAAIGCDVAVRLIGQIGVAKVANDELVDNDFLVAKP